MTVIHPTKKEVLSEFRRGGIVRGARKVFARHGYDGATMDDVAEAGSIAKGTLYLYFKSKRQIYLAVLKEDIASLREETRDAIEHATTTESRIRAFVTTRFDFCDRHRDFFRIYNSDVSAIFSSAHPTQKDIREFYFEQAAILASVIEDGIRNGELRDVPALPAAFALYDSTRACIARRILGITNGEGDAEVLLDLILKGIRAS